LAQALLALKRSGGSFAQRAVAPLLAVSVLLVEYNGD